MSTVAVFRAGREALLSCISLFPHLFCTIARVIIVALMVIIPASAAIESGIVPKARIRFAMMQPSKSRSPLIIPIPSPSSLPDHVLP